MGTRHDRRRRGRRRPGHRQGEGWARTPIHVHNPRTSARPRQLGRRPKYGGSGGFQFGSTEKAFTLVTALEQGLPINTTVNAKQAGPSQAATYTNADTARCVRRPKRAPAWNVRNDETAGGQMTLTQATARSINTAFVALAGQVGVCDVQATETRMGLHRADGNPISKVGPSGIILGAQEVSPMTVASAYGSLANNGSPLHADPGPEHHRPRRQGAAVRQAGTKNCTQVVDPEVSHGVASIMTSVLTGNGTGAKSALAGGRIAAGKTGTTDKNNETWFVGYTPQLTTAVWVGTPLGNSQALDNIALPGGPYKTVFGASIAAPTWKAIMDYALAGQPNVGFPAPSDKVSNGDKVDFGSVAGSDRANATAALQAQGFTVTVGRRVNSNYRPGLVAYTNPQGTANRGSQITLYISAGPAPQPQPTTEAATATTQPATPPPAGGGTNGRQRQRERQRERIGARRTRLAPASAARQPASTLPDDGGHPAAVGASGHARLDGLHDQAHLRHTRRSGLGDRLARRCASISSSASCAGR